MSPREPSPRDGSLGVKAERSETAFAASLEARRHEIIERCSRCGRCVEVCPSAGARWAETCTGSGACRQACDDGVNPRFMLSLTRLRLNERRAEEERRAA